MPYPFRHRLLTVFGDSWGGVEEFSFSVRLIGPTAPVQADVDALVAPTQTFWNTAAMNIDSQHRLLGVKLAPIGTDGFYPPGEVSVEALVTPDPGPGAGGNHWAPQCCVCVTTTTDTPRGHAAMGRFYLPSMTGEISASGRQPAGLNATIAAAAATWLSAVQATTAGNPVVLSKVGVGANHEITGVRVGDVIDTQRRRRRQLVESYAVAALS